MPLVSLAAVVLASAGLEGPGGPVGRVGPRRRGGVAVGLTRAEPVSQSGDWRLVGTLQSDDPDIPSRALIEDASGNQQAVAEGQPLGGCLLEEVGRRDISLACAGGLVTLTLESRIDGPDVIAEPYEPKVTYQVTVPAKDFRMEVSNRQRLANQLSLAPDVRDGRTHGWRVDYVEVGGRFHRWGLRRGDVIVGLNNTPVSEPGPFMQTLNGLEDARTFDCEVERDGERIRYQVILE